MLNIVICGSGAFARELYCWIRQSEAHQNIKFKGFLDKDNASLVSFKLDEYYLGHEDSYVLASDDHCLIAISDVHLRKSIYEKLKGRGFKFFNYAHESVVFGGSVQFGDANIICPYSVLTANISIGNANIFNINTTIGHDVVVDSFNTFSSHCDLTGYVSVGNANFFGSRVSLLPKCRIGYNNKVAAGSVVYKGIKNDAIYLGNPARKVGSNA